MDRKTSGYLKCAVYNQVDVIHTFKFCLHNHIKGCENTLTILIKAEVGRAYDCGTKQTEISV